jgi:hypothetical protein
MQTGGVPQAVEHLVGSTSPEYKPPSHQKKKKKKVLKNAWVTHAYNPIYSGGRDQEDRSSKPAWGVQFRRPYIEKNHHKKGLVE